MQCISWMGQSAFPLWPIPNIATGSFASWYSPNWWRALQVGGHSRPVSRRSVASSGSQRAGASGRFAGSPGASRRMGSIVRKGDEHGMVLPFEPLSMAFSHIHYSVDLPSVSPHQRALRGLAHPVLVLIGSARGLVLKPRDSVAMLAPACSLMEVCFDAGTSVVS